MPNPLFQAAAPVVAAVLLATGAAIATQAVKPERESPNSAAASTRPAAPPRSEAETIAEAFLKAGSDLFDARGAAALAATYTEDGEILLIGKRDGQLTDDTKRGRAAIEEFYRDFFRAANAIDSENTVEMARLIAPDVLVVHGRFRPNPGQAEWPFVQMRVKRGDRWLLSKLWLFLNPGE